MDLPTQSNMMLEQWLAHKHPQFHAAYLEHGVPALASLNITTTSMWLPSFTSKMFGPIAGASFPVPMLVQFLLLPSQARDQFFAALDSSEGCTVPAIIPLFIFPFDYDLQHCLRLEFYPKMSNVRGLKCYQLTNNRAIEQEQAINEHWQVSLLSYNPDNPEFDAMAPDPRVYGSDHWRLQSKIKRCLLAAMILPPEIYNNDILCYEFRHSTEYRMIERFVDSPSKEQQPRDLMFKNTRLNCDIPKYMYVFYDNLYSEGRMLYRFSVVGMIFSADVDPMGNIWSLLEYTGTEEARQANDYPRKILIALTETDEYGSFRAKSFAKVLENLGLTHLVNVAGGERPNKMRDHGSVFFVQSFLLK